MKNIFIDFEATQYTQEIISIGAVSNEGEEFYSLVKSKHKIGNFVSNLTGITEEDLKNAPTADEVFSKFFFWLQEINKDDKKIQFICYGNSDLDFATNTLKNIEASMIAQIAISAIISNIVDYADYVKSYFGLSKYASLLRVAQYYSKKELKQDHNALNDAKLLKFIYEEIQKGAPLVENPFEEYMQRIEVYDTKNNLIETFFGMMQATKWIIEISHMPENTYKKRIKNKIISASQQKQTYCGFKWVIAD